MSTKYQMWLTYNGEKEKLQFPVLPETINIKSGSNNDNLNIAGLGEITIMQSRPAYQFSFSSFFPKTRFPDIAVSSLTAPLTLVEKIKNWKASDKPVHFIITSCGIDLYCTIENFDTNEDGGDVGTIYYSITLKEYREVAVRQVSVKVESVTATATVEKSSPRVDNTVAAKTYTVKRGDCLWNIAKAQLGSGSRYTEIYNLNKSVIGRNPNLIYAGQVLTLPK